MEAAAGRTGAPRGGAELWLLALAMAVMALLALPVSAAADVGFRDFSYGTATSAPTAEKPQSELWFNDGRS